MCIVCSRFIHAEACDRIFLSFKTNIQCMFMLYLVYPFMHRMIFRFSSPLSYVECCGSEQECYLFKILFSILWGVYQEVGLQDHMIILWETSILFFITDAKFCFTTSSPQGFQFLSWEQAARLGEHFHWIGPGASVVHMDLWTVGSDWQGSIWESGIQIKVPYLCLGHRDLYGS